MSQLFGRLAFISSCLFLTAPSFAQPSKQDWTVVTLAQNGSWGVATDPSQASAIASAIRDCKAMSAEPSDCGASLNAIRGGWTLGVVCGTYKMIAAERDLAGAEAALLYREIDLVSLYVTNLPRCQRVITVDPAGAVRPATPLLARVP